MSVITSLTCTPNRLFMVVRLLHGTSHRVLSRADLFLALAPRSLRPGDAETSTVDGVIAEAVQLGVLQLADGKCELCVDVPAKTDPFRLWIHRRLTDPDLARASGQAEFAKALAWFLLQDPREPLASRSVDAANSPAARIGRDYGSESITFELTNDARFQNFAYWARYLGYAWFLDVEARTLVVPDPTEAIRRELAQDDDLRKHQLGVRDFVDRLGQKCPVLEGGAFHDEVEALLPPEKRRNVERDGLSPAISVALQSLEKSGFLKLVSLADSPGLVLETLSGHRPISHVTVRGGHG